MTDVAELIRLETQQIDALTAHIRSMIDRLGNRRSDPFRCRGCGEEVSGEFGDICRACDYERQAEDAADMRREGG